MECCGCLDVASQGLKSRASIGKSQNGHSQGREKNARSPKKRERGGTLEVGGPVPILVCDVAREALPGSEDFFRQTECGARARSAGDRDGANRIARRVNNAGHSR